MTDERQISKAVISRLPRYYRYLGELMEEGIERISSNELSARMKASRDTDIMLSISIRRSQGF